MQGFAAAFRRKNGLLENHSEWRVGIAELVTAVDLANQLIAGTFSLSRVVLSVP